MQFSGATILVKPTLTNFFYDYLYLFALESKTSHCILCIQRLLKVHIPQYKGPEIAAFASYYTYQYIIRFALGFINSAGICQQDLDIIFKS